MKSKVAIVKSPKIPGTPTHYENDAIKTIEEMIEEVFELSIGGLNNLIDKNMKVLIKPNIAWPCNPELSAITDPRVIEALIRYIKKQVKVKEVIVGEGPVLGTWTAREVFHISGIEGVVKRAGGKCVYFDEVPRVIMKNEDAKVFDCFSLPKPLLEADVYINLPKLKVHAMEMVSLGIKNQMGLLLEERLIAHNSLSQKLVDILKVIRPDYTLVDGIWALQGNGSIPSNPEEYVIKDMNVLIGGTDVVAVDAIASMLMGYNPENIDVLRIAAYEGIGKAHFKDIEVVGRNLNEVKRNFIKPDLRVQAVYPNVEVYMGGACKYCTAFLAEILTLLNARGILKKLISPLKIIIGKKLHLSTKLKDHKGYILFGDCAIEDNAKLGEFVIEGCPPLMNFLNFIKAVEKHVGKKLNLSEILWL
ncbi:MAG: DUF362 domain-containing protein [Candidatus Bathyarchaeia archaeon]